MASRRPSSRPSSRRRSSGSEAARTTREINAEKSRQRRAAAKASQSSKSADASATRQKSARGGRKEEGTKRSFFRRTNADMQRQLDLWNDPDYISTQARERLGFVRPGETQYTVVDPGPQYQDSALAAAAASTGPARPWVQQLGILVGKADQPPSATPIPSAETSQSGQAPTTSQESGE